MGNKPPATNTTEATKETLVAPKANWIKIEADYRVGLKSLRAMSEQYGVSHVTIHKRAVRDGWERNLGAQIKAKAEAKVAEAAANAGETKATETQVVEAGAVLMANTILAERADVARLRKLANALGAELEGQVAKADKRRLTADPDVSVKVDPLDKRIDSLRKLADTTRTLINLERVVLNIAPDTPIDPSARVAEAIDNGFVGLKEAFNKKLGKPA